MDPRIKGVIIPQNEELNDSAYFLESCEIDYDKTENKPLILNLEICVSHCF